MLVHVQGYKQQVHNWLLDNTLHGKVILLILMNLIYTMQLVGHYDIFVFVLIYTVLYCIKFSKNFFIIKNINIFNQYLKNILL